jgi:hypothetical protein
MVTLARIAIWVLSVGGAILTLLILSGSGSEDLQGKVVAATLLFALFSFSLLPGFLLIERRPGLTFFGAMTIGLSTAAFFVVLEALLSDGIPQGHSSVWTLVIIAFAGGQASMLLAFKHDEDSPLVNAVLAGGLVVLALLVVLAIIEISNPGTDIGPKVYATLAVLYLLGALLPPCLRWDEVEKA